MKPITGASNGRGVDDPGANGAISPVSHTPTQNGMEIRNWMKGGFYCNQTYVDTYDLDRTGYLQGGVKHWYDGTDYYLQMRIKMDPACASAQYIDGSYHGGKLFWLSNTRSTSNANQLVTESKNITPGGDTGSPNYHRMYGAGSVGGNGYGQLGGPGYLIQNGSQLGQCDVYHGDVGGCWAYSGGWDTLLYHLTPGVSEQYDSHIEVWAQRDLTMFPNEAGKYVKIWDYVFQKPWTIPVSGDIDNPLKNDYYIRPGHNCVIPGYYVNKLELGYTTTISSWHKYGELIFSKQFIPAPTI